MYFVKDWRPNRCTAVSYMTQYSMAARDDYKRCICDNFGAGEVDCALDEDAEPEPQPEP